MSEDFEIQAKLRAKQLIVHVPPDEGETTGENATIARRELGRGLPERLRPSGHYGDVAVKKEVLGSLVEPPS